MLTRVIVSARQMRFMLYSLFSLIVADGILSDFLVTQNLGREWNPFLKTLVGSEQLLLIKVCGALLVIIIMWNMYKKRPGMAVISSLCFLVLYTGIIYWNLFSFVLTGVF